MAKRALHKFLEDLHKLTYTMINNLLEISLLILGLGKLLLNYELNLVQVRLKLSMSKLVLGVSSICTLHQVYLNYCAKRIL